jgi:Spy/CpxP family protein refolding chaperone
VNNWKVIPTIVFATVLIFGAGVFTGGILVDYVKQARPHPGATRSKPPAQASTAAPTNNSALSFTRQPPQVLSKDFLQRLDGELHLTKDEHEAVQKIISDGQNQMRKVLQDSRLEIREVLTPEQRDQFDELMKHPFHKPIFYTNAPSATSPPAMSTNAP